MIRQLFLNHSNTIPPKFSTSLLAILLMTIVSACFDSAQPAADQSSDTEATTLHVAATTSIIGDVVAQIGGSHIALFTLIPPGVDPHSYTATPQDLRKLANVDLIFVNGLHLEEGLTDLLNESTAPKISVNRDVPLLAVADHDVTTHTADAEEDHDHGDDDPHTWQSVANVQQWLPVITEALVALDPANRADYEEAAADYDRQLVALDDELRDQIDTIPPAQRKLVTDHESLNYFAHDYGFTVVGALIPSLSSLAESSAQELAALQDQVQTEQVPAIFIGATANPNLAEQLAQDLGIDVVPLYTGALSPQDGPAPTYLAFMRYNVNAIVTALRPIE